MFWDEQFWETILINYVSALGVAVTLFALGFGGYEVYIYRKRKKKIKTKIDNL